MRGVQLLMSRNQESALNQRNRSQPGVSRQFLAVCTVGGSGRHRESISEPMCSEVKMRQINDEYFEFLKIVGVKESLDPQGGA